LAVDQEEAAEVALAVAHPVYQERRRMMRNMVTDLDTWAVVLDQWDMDLARWDTGRDQWDTGRDQWDTDQDPWGTDPDQWAVGDPGLWGTVLGQWVMDLWVTVPWDRGVQVPWAMVVLMAAARGGRMAGVPAAI
jgi:hypothetical protein